MGQYPKITTQKLANITGLSVGGIEKVIRILKTEGELYRSGPDKGGEWKVINKNESAKKNN